MRRIGILMILFLIMIFLPVTLQGQALSVADTPHPTPASKQPDKWTPVGDNLFATFSPDFFLSGAALNQTPTAPTDLGDWSNEAALACIFSLGPILNASTVASLLIKPPPFDYPPSAVAYLSNLSLKFCAPYLNPPSDIQTNPSNCVATFVQYETAGTYGNIMGFPSPFSDLLPGTNWGQMGTPILGHWSTNVAVTARHAGSISGDQIRFDTGIHPVIWRGDTLLHPMDLVFIYIPGLGQERETLRTALNAGKFLLDKGLRLIIDAQPNPHGIYNEEVQYIVVTDFVKPTISTSMQNVTVEAIEPGGVSQNNYMNTLRHTITTNDNCDEQPELIAHDAPAFAAVGQTYTIQWEVRDDGPHDLSGGYNNRFLNQILTVADTKPPIILPPPPLVTETAVIPAPLAIGHPAVFDLADLDPAVSHNACSRPGVSCTPQGTIRFPAGQTLVTWTAVDQSGNSTSATQLINVKAPGSNHTPSAHYQTGNNSPEAVSFEPITLTLTAADSDNDPLWFTIAQQPENGFFHAPLLPYFIQDYRLANVNEIDFAVYCADPDHHQEYVPTNWPIEADFMAVDDAGNTYVHDNGMIWCDSFGQPYSDYRLAIFWADGTWTQSTSSFDVKDIYLDQRHGFIYTTSTNVGGTFTFVRKFDLDLNQVGSYRIDYADYPLAQGARAGLGDEQGLIYATNGFLYSGVSQLYVYDGRNANGGSNGDLIRVADYSLPNVNWLDLALDSEGNLYASANKAAGHRIYKFSPVTLDESGNFVPGSLIGWLGKCDFGPGCDIQHGRSFGFSCTDTTCGLNGGSSATGSGPGQFDLPRGIALDPNDILYVTDYNNLRVQRFTPDGYFAGQAVSECDGSCFVLGDFGNPEQVTVNSTHFYVLDDNADLLHVFETTPLTHVDDTSATIVYRSDNNFVGTDSFLFQVTDGLDSSPPAQVTIDVSRNFRPPQADRGLQFTAVEDTSLPLTLSGYDPDEPLDMLTYQVATPPAHGTMSGVEPNRTYTPAPDFTGVDTFTFVANDGHTLSAPQTVTVTVTAVNDPPRFPEENQNFAFRASSGTFNLSRLSTLEDMQVGRGYNTLFKIDFFEADAADIHLITVDWGDGTPLEEEGELLEDGTITGPLLSEGINGGTGSITAEHIFNQNGNYNVTICVTDNVVINSAGEKETTPASTTACEQIPVTVAPMTDILLDIEASASPVALAGSLAYTLTVTNNAPDSGPGLTATGLVVSSTLDSRLDFQYATTDDGSCTRAGLVVTCQLGTLAPAAAAVIRIGTSLNNRAVIGDRLEHQAGYRLNQLNQSDNPLAFASTTVVTPADFIVNTIADEPDNNTDDTVCRTANGRCSLRAALQQANAQAGLQTIALDFQRYWLNEDLEISDDVHLIGLGANNSLLASNGLSRILLVQNEAQVTLTGLAIMGGQAGSEPGGGIYNVDAAVLLEGVLVSQNQADSGGGIWNGGTLTLNNSAITGNLATGNGGGIYNEGDVTLANVTLSGNTAQNGGGLSSFGSATLTNVTVSHNQASGSGGGLQGSANAFTLNNTILAGNTAVATGPNCDAGFTSQGHNLLDDTTDCPGVGQTTTDIYDTEARLLPLNQNKGHTPTTPLAGGSPAIDAGSCILATDQRGILRPVDGNLDGNPLCDMGAYEFTPLHIYLPILSH